MSNTAFDRANNFGVTAHPEVGRRLWRGYVDSAGNIHQWRAPSLHSGWTTTESPCPIFQDGNYFPVSELL